MEEITLSPSTKGVLVYARSKLYLSRNWLVLISCVESHSGKLYIRRHASIRIGDDERFYFDDRCLKTDGWGFADGYDFFKPTEEQIQFMVNKLKEKRIKFIPILNKLIKV